MKLTEMKKLVLLLLTVFALASCSIDDDGPNYFLETLPVTSFTVPDTLVYNQPAEIKLKYKRPSDCYFYEGIYYEKKDNTRVIAVQSSVLQSDKCVPYTEEKIIEASFNFVATGPGPYTFKFYKGEDETGKNIFEEVTVPVTY